jgi:vancomycin permeability regulator SanA
MLIILLKLLTAGLILGLLAMMLPRLVTGLYAWNRITPAAAAPVRKVAIVFGAGLWRDGSPTPVLQDRVAAAAELYFNGKVEKLLMSGDNSYVYHNEPGAMHDYAVNLGVPEKDIVLDYAGRRTYDTCYRAKAIFGVQEAILVTQSFHLPRALYLCNHLGLPAVGVSADLRVYQRVSMLYWNLRELPATLTALWEVYITRPLPVLGDPEPIFPNGL